LKNINLLPRKPLLNQIYIPLMIVMILVFVGCGVFFFFSSFHTEMNMDAEQKKVELANKRVAALTAQHQIDPQTQDYHTFAALLQQLKESRRDWAPIFDLITKNLYKTSRLLTMDINDKGVMSLNLEFASVKEVAYYTTLLQNSNLVEQVSIKDISISKKSKLIGKTQGSPVETGKSVSGLQTTTLVSYSVSMQIQLKSLVSGK
jgi:hypothetical protein